MLRDFEEDLGARLDREADFFPGRDEVQDREEDAREDAERLVRVASSSGVTRERVSIPMGPCAVVRLGDWVSSVAVGSLDLSRVDRLFPVLALLSNGRRQGTGLPGVEGFVRGWVAETC